MSTGNERSRGYFKIKGAASAFNFDFKDKIVLDIGSSTGGFTEYALEMGAKKVIAIEKGTNQMKSPLRLDPRVELHEKTDIFEVSKTPISRDDFHEKTDVLRIQISSFEGFRSAAARDGAREPRGDGRERRGPRKNLICIPVPDVILADVSFLRLTKVLKYAKMNLARSNTDFLVMLKPQFEAAPNDLRNGIVKNETTRRTIIKNFEQWLKENGFLIIKKRDNDLKGRRGNTERFYWLKQSR